EHPSIFWHTLSQESTALNIFEFEEGEAGVVLMGSLEHFGEESPTYPLTRLMRCGSMGPP
ncbi:MAG: hypothetical protein WCD51_12940, partial [Anaerolineae bacterium]